MSAEPPQGAPRSGHEPHRLRESAESFGVDAERYDRARPRYPAAMVERIVAAGPGRDIVDVGCGTGIAARQFQAAGCRVLGVEHDGRMAAWARRRGVEVEVAAFEEWDPAGRLFDAVVAGQSWHWMDPRAGAAKAASALRQGGRLSVFWNSQRPAPEVAEAFSAVYRRVGPGAIAAREWRNSAATFTRHCATAAGGIRTTGAFGEPEQWRLDWERRYTREEWLDQVPTSSVHNLLSPAEKEEVMSGIAAAIDGFGGGLTMPYATLVVTASRLG